MDLTLNGHDASDIVYKRSDIIIIWGSVTRNTSLELCMQISLMLLCVSLLSGMHLSLLDSYLSNSCYVFI